MYDKIRKHYETLLEELLDEIGDDLHDLVIEVKTNKGETASISWKEREVRLED